MYRDGGGFDGAARCPLILYGVKMIVNWSFSPIFFGHKKLGLVRNQSIKKQVMRSAHQKCFKGAISVASLWAMVAMTGTAFYDVYPNAGLLFIPYQVI